MANTIDFSAFIKNSITAEYRGMNYIEYADGGIEMYISFQTLLRFISENLNLVSNGKDIVSIDWESDKPFYALSCHISTDLTKCYLYNKRLKIEDGTNPDPNFATFHPFDLFRDSNLTEVNSNLLVQFDNIISFVDDLDSFNQYNEPNRSTTYNNFKTDVNFVVYMSDLVVRSSSIAIFSIILYFFYN